MSTQRCIENFQMSLMVKEFLKSVKILQSYCQNLVATFFGTQCTILHLYMAAIFVLAAILDLKKCHPTFLRSLWYPHSESTDNLLLTNIIHESNFNYITAYTMDGTSSLAAN